MEIKAQLNQLRHTCPQISELSDQQLIQRFQHTVQSQIAKSDGPNEDDLEWILAWECVGIGEQLWLVGRWQEAERWLFVALEKAEKAGDLIGQCQATGALGRVLRDKGEFPQAMALYNQTLGLAERLGDKRLQGVTYDQIGLAYKMQGKYIEAIENFKTSLVTMEGIGEMTAPTYGNLGNVYEEQGDYVLAIEAFEKALAQFLQLGYQQGVAQTYGNLGIVYRGQGRYEQAADMYRKCLAITERLGDEATSANQYGNLGDIYTTQGDLDNAILMFEQALKIMQRIGDEPKIAMQYSGLGKCYQLKNDTVHALQLYEKSLGISKRIGDKYLEAQTYLLLGTLYHLKLDDPIQSRDHYEKARALYEMLGNVEKAQEITEALREV